MNTNTGNDPMLSSFINDDWGKLTSTTASPALSLVISQPSTSTFLVPADETLSSDHNFSDLASMWSNERRRVSSVKMEDEDSFSSYSVTEDVDEVDTDMGEIDIGDSTTGTNIKCEIDDHGYGDVAAINSGDIREFKFETSKCIESEARRFVEEQFEKISFVPKPTLSQREKIEAIVAKSDCSDFSVEEILNFDKKCPNSARACAKIVQNIPQRYRWECVQPEDIPSCYTIVADCKKVSSRDKPPRPMNAFMIWAQGARRLINELCPKMQNAIISEALGFYWREKSEAFKQRFEQEKMKLRIFHNVEFPEYKYKPKTRVQKAEEKQQLSLTKAKIRASVKLEKLRKTEESNFRRTNTGGRPNKKTSQDSPKKKVNNSPLSQILLSEKAARKSPMKPAIKDMLTLKILNDRKCRGVASVARESRELFSKKCTGVASVARESRELFNRKCTGVAPEPRELFSSSFGQMSPLEMTDIDVDENTDDVQKMSSNGCSLDIAAPRDKDGNAQVTPPSVFDTPANTPPVDDVNDDRHSSPPQQASYTSSSEQSHHIRGNISPNSETSEILSPVHVLHPKHDHGLTLLDLVSRSSTLSCLKQRPASTSDQVLDVTDWLFNFISQSLSTAEQTASSKYSSSTTDSNNNSSDLNNNCYTDVNNNNNNTDLTTSSVDNRNNWKLTDCPTDTSDLDTLLLDLSAPLLSDDDLQSIMSTL